MQSSQWSSFKEELSTSCLRAKGGIWRQVLPQGHPEIFPALIQDTQNISLDTYKPAC